MRRSSLATAFVVLMVTAAGCQGCNSSEPACFEDGATCATSSDCCSKACKGNTCVPSAECTGHNPGDPCTGAGDCCTNKCENGICIEDPCTALGESCTANQTCCDGYCNPSTSKCGPGDVCHGAGEQCFGNLDCCSHVCTGGSCAPCGDRGASCTADDECCPGKRCDLARGQCLDSDCIGAGDACVQGVSCCGGLRCSGGTCPSGQCITSGTTSASACASGSQCCSGICSGGHCSKVPGPGGICTTLYESCAANSDCCSTNCAGPDGAKRCMPAYWCNAVNDICFGPDDCCTHLCSASGGNPGRCQSATGSGCTEDGLPCANNSNCCTRRCNDLGTGVTVCQVAAGCRMTGDYCDSTQSCCGGAGPDSDPTGRSPYGVYCDMTGQRDYSPYWDKGTHDSFVCTAGQSCNPPGNICGDSASQNCCHPGGGSGTPYCWPDLSGIMRCHLYCGPDCTTGCDGTNPNCCREPAEICTTPQDCCNLSPCVPDQTGVMRCMCLPQGSICSRDPAPSGGPGTVHTYTSPQVDPCCAPQQCTWIGSELGWMCAQTGCSRYENDACNNSSECCAGTCVGGRCKTCTSDGGSCATDAACCSGHCDSTGHCSSCVPDDRDCTADSDCCSLVCSYLTHKCGTAECAGHGESCATFPCCPGTGDVCRNGLCVTPETCPDDGYACSTTNPCCGGRTPELRCHSVQGSFPATCTAGDSNCFCEACAAQNESCSSSLPCCGTSESYCANSASLAPCAPGDASCYCKSVSG